MENETTLEQQEKKIRLVYYGDAPSVATGFGTVSRNILLPLHMTGQFDITVFGVNYWGEPHKFPFPIWPVGFNSDNDPYGRKRIQEHIKTLDFDILFMTQDSFILEFVRDFIPELHEMGKKFVSVLYYPIDGFPKKSWVEAMSTADVAVTYTEWGKRQCIMTYPPIADKIRAIPHGVNTKEFYPVPYKEMLQFRRQFFARAFDKFIITDVNRNQLRKDYPRLMLAFREFKKIHPDTFLYCHCAVKDQGWDLEKVADSLGLCVGRDVAFPTNFGPNKGYPRHIVNLIYNASDAVVSSTIGEGWGLSTVEAMATRTPVIFPANTSLVEILGDDRGLLVKSGDTLSNYAEFPFDNEVLRPLCSVEDMVEKMCILYENEYLRYKLADNAYKWVTTEMDWFEHISPKWINLMYEAYQSLMDPDAKKEVEAEEL